MTRVAAVIVNLDGGGLVERALRALERQTVRPARVIVVDNASTDGSPDAIAAEFPDVELVRLTENVGFAAANNLAVRMADDCECVALLNPDAFPEPGWLERLLDAAARHPQYAFFGSRLLKADRPAELDGAGDVYHVSGIAWRRYHGRPAAGRALAEEEVFSPCAAAAFYRRDAFVAVGGFDESYFCYYEDNDLALRLRLRGNRCLYVPDAVAHHVGSAIAGAVSDFTLFHSYRNLIWTYVKGMPPLLFWLYLPQLVLVNAALLAALLLRGRPGVLLRAQGAALRDLPRVLRQRREVQRARVVSALQLRRIMARGLPAYASAVVHARLAWRRARSAAAA
jgi:GT2 family glycosyltransferase